MTQIKAFLKRHLLAVGFGAVLLPLLVILGLQYRSLRALETALPAWRKQELKTFLRDLNQETEMYYRTEAERALALPASAIGNRLNGAVIVTRKKSEVLQHLAGAAAHFRQQAFPGSKRFFVAVTAQYQGRHWCAILFYDPVSGRMKLDQYSPEWLPIMLAFAPYCVKIRQFSTLEPGLVGLTYPHNQHFLFKPIADANGRLIAVAGAVLDQEYFRTTVLPAAIRRTIAQHFPQHPQEVIVTARDAANQLMLANQPEAPTEAEAMGHGDFVFRDWTLGVRTSRLTEAQKARQTFVLTISFSALMAFLLMGGLGLALRIAAREMKLSQMKSDFVSNVSHELRTPLSSIQVFGELLKHGRAADATVAREFGAYIETESRRLTQLINKILDFSRIESGRKEYRFVPLDVGALVAETVKAYEVLLPQEGFALRLAIAPTPAVYADAEALTQAVVNLLDNAVKYSGTGRVIQLRVAPQDENIIIAVTDQGIGIAAAEQSKIFEKFYRVNTGYVHDVKGSGLGLAIVWHIAEAHHGKVTVTSTPGQGSTFTLHLPVHPNEQAAPAAWQVDVQWEGR
jgi:signal transduction histidine kinase